MIQPSLKSHRAARQSGKLSRNIKDDILALAILRADARRTQNTIREIRRSIEAAAPGASRLARNAQVLERFRLEHNARAAKAS